MGEQEQASAEEQEVARFEAFKQKLGERIEFEKQKIKQTKVGDATLVKVESDKLTPEDLAFFERMMILFEQVKNIVNKSADDISKIDKEALKGIGDGLQKFATEVQKFENTSISQDSKNWLGWLGQPINVVTTGIESYLEDTNEKNLEYLKEDIEIMKERFDFLNI